MTQLHYALDAPIRLAGGAEHVRQALQGANLKPANYSFISSDNNRVVYHVCGRGGLLIIATAPGWGVGINYLPTSLKPIVDSGKATVVAIQPRGSLPSERPSDEKRMSSKHMASDIEALRQHLNHETVVVLGHSNGAAIALAYAILFPSHCAKAVLIETQTLGFKDENGSFMDDLNKRQHDPRYADAVAAFKRGMSTEFSSDEEHTEWLKQVLPLYFWDPKTGIAQFALNTGPLLVQNWPSTKQDVADSQPEAKLFADLHKITAQVLLISGEDDFICRVPASRAAKDAIGAKARHAIYSKCGHMPWIESKDAFFTDLTEFLFY